MKSHRATLIRVLTQIAENPDSTIPQRLEAIKLAMVLKSKGSRAALTRVDKAIADLIGRTEPLQTPSKPAVNQSQ